MHINATVRDPGPSKPDGASSWMPQASIDLSDFAASSQESLVPRNKVGT